MKKNSQTQQQHYQKLDPISHIHHRPDMYVGSIKSTTGDEWIFRDEGMHFQKDTVSNPGLLRIFVEVLSNVIDNVWRSQQAGVPCEKIQIEVERDSITVTNDGQGIPFTCYKDTDIRIPELIFGHLLTSTNYDDKEQRLTSGRNGLGVKLTNVFSTSFAIELYNLETKEVYRQRWENNMRTCHPPKIRSKAPGSLKSSYVSITFQPDFERFGMTEFPEDFLHLIYKYCVDCAMITRLPVVLNKKKIRIKCLSDYVKLFPILNPKECVVLEKSDALEVVVCSSDRYQEMVFTNGVYNKYGGVHCDAIIQDVCRQLLQKIQSKLKSQSVSTKDLKQYFRIFVNAKVVNPEFSNQSKDRLLSPSIRYACDPKFIQYMMKWSFMDKVRETIEFKEMKTLKKVERKKVRIEGYDPANLAGTKFSQECTLIICEGLSAKTYAVNGINVGWNGVKGRDRYGIYPLRGKSLNVRNASLQTIMNNKEVMDIANILNLKYKQTNSLNDLNYGRIMILTDADVDGIHIASLLLNYFDVLYPNLFDHSFFYMMLTPIAKVNSNVFYNEHEYRAFLESQQSRSLKVKYYKGLGTSSSQEVKDTFGKKVIRFLYDDKAKSTLNKVFHQKFAGERKAWLEAYDASKYQPIQDECRVSDFINHELIKFSIDDCRRNIPNLFDGLKLSQRKILYSIFKKNLVHTSPSMKVAQLAGYVAEVSNYHHGEQCLFDTIIKMTHDFVGSNNVPLLYPDGQFGTRLYLGKDAANGRYIFTKMQPYTRILFSKDDEPLLHTLYDDNDPVEPEYYLPIVPMILVNGCHTGIGTGWSCSIPSYDPLDIMECIMEWIGARQKKVAYEMRELAPHFKGFQGRITRVDASKYMSHGIFQVLPKNRVVVTEIPVTISTDKYKEFLETLVDERKIKNLKNYSTTESVHFEFTIANPSFVPTEESLRMTSTIHLTNMVLFGKDHKLQKFHSIADIFECFCTERYDMYEKRKRHVLKTLERALKMLQNKSRFLKMILSKQIRVDEMHEDDVREHLQREHGFERIDKDDDFSYLLNMSIRSMTKTKLVELESSIVETTAQIEALRKTTTGQLWKADLKSFKEAMQKRK